MNVASVERVRTQFPALARREAGRPAAYFDGPGGTQVPHSVARAVSDYLLHHNANTHWAYPTSAETDALLAGARKAMADLLSCRPQEVVFGANMTTLTYHVSRALGRRLGPGDEILTTRLDHQANVAPWKALVAERGIRVREVPFDAASGALDREALADAIGASTRLVAVGAASNALGTINDVAEVVEWCHAAGALSFVDAVHYVPHALPDVQRLGCDALACSPYKFYGPHLGVLYMREELQEELDVPRLPCVSEAPPERMETGTLSHEAIVGAGAAVDFLAGLAHPGPRDPRDRRSRLEASYAELHTRGEALVAQLWKGLESIDSVTLYGPRPGQARTPTVAFAVRRKNAEEVARYLSRQLGVFVSHGDFYASTVVEDLDPGPGGLVRAGAACYTTADEVDRLARGVAEIARS